MLHTQKTLEESDTNKVHRGLQGKWEQMYHEHSFKLFRSSVCSVTFNRYFVYYPPNDDVLMKNSRGRAGCLYLHPHSREMRGSSLTGWITGYVDREIKPPKTCASCLDHTLPPQEPLTGIQPKYRTSCRSTCAPQTPASCCQQTQGGLNGRSVEYRLQAPAKRTNFSWMREGWRAYIGTSTNSDQWGCLPSKTIHPHH